MEDPRISIITESLQKEKQIVVDPLSLKDSPIIKQGYLDTTIMLQPIITACASSPMTLLHPPPLQPPKQGFLSLSLPNSANSSPRFASPLSKKKSKGGWGSPEQPQCQQASKLITNTLQHLLLQELQLQKSKSCGEGRVLCATPSSDDEFDHWLAELSAKEHDKWEWHHVDFTTKTEKAVKESPKTKSVKQMKTLEDGFKCSSLCLYLPSFGGKVRPVKTRKEGSERGAATMSRTVSLEKFECGSWASSAAAMFHHEIDGESNNSYFDLPMELIKCSANEVYSPMSASLVYERDLKGVLKNGSSRGSARKSDASPRHVRFSTPSSSPSSYPSSPASPCIISPRLRKAREDFNAFLAAQSA